MLGFLLGYGLLHDGIHALKDLSHGHDEDGTYKDSYGATCWCTTGSPCRYMHDKKGDFGIGKYGEDVLWYRNFDDEARVFREYNAICDSNRTTYLLSTDKAYGLNINNKLDNSCTFHGGIYEDLFNFRTYGIVSDAIYTRDNLRKYCNKYEKEHYFYVDIKTGIMVRPSDGELMVSKERGEDNTKYYEEIINNYNKNRKKYIKEKAIHGEEVKFYMPHHPVNREVFEWEYYIFMSDIYKFKEGREYDRKRLTYDETKKIIPEYRHKINEKKYERMRINLVPKTWQYEEDFDKYARLFYDNYKK